MINYGLNFFGAWIIKQLLSEGADVTVADLRADDNILAQVLTPEELSGLTRVYGDIGDAAFVTLQLLILRTSNF